MWIKEYSDVLGTICPGWTSEQIVKRKTPPKTSSGEEKAASEGDDQKPPQVKSTSAAAVAAKIEADHSNGTNEELKTDVNKAS